jgi:hypothetical protein
MTAASPSGVTYTGTADPLTNKITIASDGFGGAILTLLFFGNPIIVDDGLEKPQLPENSIGQVLGFAPTDYDSSLTYTGANVPNLDPEPVLFLHIDELEHVESNNSAVHNAFAMIPMIPSLQENGFIVFSDEQHPPTKHFSPPAGKISYLTVSIRTSTGSIYDFNGRDYILNLRFTTKDPAISPYAE